MKPMKYIFLISVLFQFTGNANAQSSSEITNEKIWSEYAYYASSVGGLNSMNDGVHYTSLDADKNNRTEIVKYAYSSGNKIETLLSSSVIFGKSMKNIEGYSFSKDESKILIETGSESIYRHSYVADFYIYDADTKAFTPINDFEKGKIRLAEFSPNGSKVAFIRDNNIFIYDVKNKKTKQITKDGEHNNIINGFPDWVYEEEFGFSKGFQWSPNSDRIAYYKFDESEVKMFHMEYYNDALYPDPYTFKYPKAGEKNSEVSIWLYDLNTDRKTAVNLGENKDIYIPRIKWTQDNNQLCIMRLNRHQNHLEFLLTDLTKKQPFEITPSVVFSEKSDTYIEINDNLTFTEDGKSFIWNSERSGFNHLYKFGLTGKTKPSPITSGNWDVIEYFGYDDNNDMVYYSSSQESPLEQHFYKKGISNREFQKLSSKKGNNYPVFSSTFEYFINYHSDANTPARISLNDNSGSEIRVLEANEELNNTLEAMNLPKKEFFTFTNSTGDELNCWMIKPSNYNSRKKYPVFVTIYGGPGHNTVNDSWGGMNYMWHQMLAQKGYLVVSCDPRGTMYRGRDFKHSTYLQLGKNETEDFIDLAKHLQTLPYVDDSRIGIQGWSYGGYMTSLCMTKGADYFTTGVAVAPVTNWKWYDSIYTERFMRTPNENPDGYEDNSPTNHVDKMKGNYLIVHGSGDDNVHMQNSMEMIRSMVDKNIDYDMLIYPNKNHGIYGGYTRLHLYNKMTDFIIENL